MKVQQTPQKHKNRPLRIALGILLFSAGLLCLIFADEIRASLPFILSGLLAFLAIDCLVEALEDKHFDEEDTENIANGLVFAVLSIISMVRWDQAESIVVAMWGILGLTLASRKLSHALYHLINRTGQWTSHLLHVFHALFTIGISALLLLDADEHLQFHIYILGIELMDYAVRVAFEEEL